MNAIRISYLSISLAENEDGTTRSLVEQVLVALTEKGNKSLDEIAGHFSFEWSMGETILNHFLTTGKMLPLQDALAVASKKMNESWYKAFKWGAK